MQVGRMAGQYAKPRSSDVEHRDGAMLPAYRGDIINGAEFTTKVRILRLSLLLCVDLSPQARIHDPQRMLTAYEHASSTLQIIASHDKQELLDNAEKDCKEVLSAFPEGHHFHDIWRKTHDRSPTEAGQETSTCGRFHTSHECLLLPYESALTHAVDGKFYGTSAHMLWIGERTRQLDHAHLHFVKGIENPIGVKISQHITADEVLRLLDFLNPSNAPGRVMLITRMGQHLRNHLPAIIQAVQAADRQVLWVCDPMHGNTVQVNGYKTRPMDAIQDEIKAFFEAHAACGSYPGGIHLEMTGEHVTECIGGMDGVSAEDLPKCYESACDPRLNGKQAIEMAFHVANCFEERVDETCLTRPAHQSGR